MPFFYTVELIRSKAKLVIIVQYLAELSMQSVKLLIIDDEVVDRAYYQRMLRQSADIPYEAKEVVNGKEALEYLKDNEVDCILLDYQLPDITGLDLLKSIKEIAGKFVPVIMLTGRGDEQVAVAAIKSGAEDYFIKNKIEPQVLMKTILNAIRSSQLKKIIYQQKKQLKYYAYYDNLTGLINRHSFEEITQYALSEAKRLQHELAILFVDIDNFMSVNDSFGYLAGNEMLIETGKRLKNVLPKEVIISRLGDDEFAILLTGVDIDIYAANVARKIIDEINKPYQLSIDTLNVSATIGISYFPGSATTLSDLLKQANVALGRAKRIMRSTFQFYSEELNRLCETDLELEKSLQDAVKTNNEFFLVYQPRYELITKKIVGVDIKLRWQHPKLGLMIPEQFMSIAEKSGLTIPIAKWALEKLAQDLKKIRAINKHEFEVVIDISLSSFQLGNYQIVDALRNLLTVCELPARSIILEINEVTLLEYIKNESVIEKLRNLSIQPVLISLNIDSTFVDRLSKLPISSLKIDKKIVNDLSKRKYSLAVIKSILQLANGLKLKVIAAGIDDETKCSLLITEGCLFGKGNYLSPALNIEDFLKLLIKEVE